MTNSNHLNIADFEKVCKVSKTISQVCEMQKRPTLEKILLNKWARIVLDSQKYGKDAFIMARGSFVNFLQSGKYVDEKSPLTLFLIDTLWLIY